ncbi:class A beta-lactamase [Embleya sp. AB8]|uniref:class A beta-lactamase n=1 Tax=Embleya sp. AB8 TaxID=3156304 RepID=UPI003C780567
MTPTRRNILSAATALAVVVPFGGRAFAGATVGELRRLESEHAARLGVFALDTATGRCVAYRADERFPICSVFKTVAVGAVLRDLDHEFLTERIHYTDEDVARSGYAPITGRPENLAAGLTGAELCAAAIQYSDNTAANLLLRALGGPQAVTDFCRSLGDEVTRLDRSEPTLNSAEPGRPTDTTSPRSIGRTYARLTLGTALSPEDRNLLTHWLLANTTGTNRLRAGLPSDWRTAEKTGTGGYGTTNDVGITWPPAGPPIVIAILATKHDRNAPADEPLLAKAAEAVAAMLR